MQEKSEVADVTPNTQAIEDTIRKMLEYIGEDPTREGLLNTPSRVRRSWEKLYGGYKMSAENILNVGFKEIDGYNEMIMLKDIDFFSTCEHHLLPIIGKAHIAYIPQNRVVGISKLARLVEIYARRLQIQERMTASIANDLWRILEPKGVAVFIQAQHFCVKARGVEKINSIMETSMLKGVFMDYPATRSEFFSMVKAG